jgi:hypothetical protein
MIRLAQAYPSITQHIAFDSELFQGWIQQAASANNNELVAPTDAKVSIDTFVQ